MKNEINLAGRTALVTGAAAGLGKAMANGLVEAGARVAFTDMPGRAVDDLRVELRPLIDAGAAFVIEGDLAVQDSRERVAAAAMAALGPIEILVNNAGIGPNAVRKDFFKNPVRFWELSGADLNRFFEINAVAPHVLTLLLLPGMQSRGWGRLINVTTSLDTMIRAGRAGYGSSKAALEAHTSTMAGDLATSGVTANVLIPGGISDTSMAPVGADFDRSTLLPVSRMVAPVVWLSSEHANNTTGRRYLAAHWDPALPWEEAEKQAGTSIAWAALGKQAIHPKEYVDPAVATPTAISR